MNATGPKLERETIICFNEQDDQASIWTASAVVAARLKKRLGMVHITGNGDRHVVFTFPKKWIILPRVRAAMSPERKAKLVGFQKKHVKTI